ncbi:MAG TPA: hypothetical protein DDY20_12715 [Desulfobulbaceae bacterium]|nr:hypothetical protein [Desulfobulbaceae bacterium]
MNPAALIPTPDILQVPWGWFQLLLLLTLYMHILLMNVMLGTAMIALVNLFRSDGDATPLARDISRKLPFAIAFTVNFGIAPLLFVQVLYGNFLYASSVLMANIWILVIALLIIGYYLAYILDYRFDALHGGRVLIIGAAVAALLAIAFLMSNNFTLMQRPGAWTRYFDHRTGMLLNLSDPTLFPRYLHFVVAAIAVGGLSLALLGDWRLRRGDQDAAAAVRSGCNWFAYATIANFGIGFWFFGVLPREVHDLASLNGILIAVLLLTGIILGALSVIYSLQNRVRPALSTALLAVLVMILMRDLVRVAYLRPFFSLADLQVEPQYSPMLLFLAVFAAGLVLIGWMLKLAWRAVAGGEVRS